MTNFLLAKAINARISADLLKNRARLSWDLSIREFARNRLMPNFMQGRTVVATLTNMPQLPRNVAEYMIRVSVDRIKRKQLRSSCRASNGPSGLDLFDLRDVPLPVT